MTEDELLELKTIAERDHAQEMADRLADAIADLLGISVGEHSNLNCPWTVALEHAQAEIDRREQRQG